MWRWVGVVTLAGCSQWFGLDSPIIRDASGPDALPEKCTDISLQCVTPDLLRSCSAPGAIPVDTQCPWGCLAPPHCARIVPAGGAATADDVAPDPKLVDVSLAAVVVDSDNGQIGSSANPTAVRGAGPGVVNGIGFEVRGNVAVFRFNSLTIAGAVNPIGSHSIVLASNGAIAVADTIDMRGSCASNAAGPGGFQGGVRGQTAPGSGGGTRGVARDEAGGGGGHGGTGGNGGTSGGTPTLGGPMFGAATIPTLVGGGGGGGGGDNQVGSAGGGGGGAIQLLSNTNILIASGGINAGGCGGKAAAQNGSGGGGGAGGTILLEAPTITIAGALAVNGGGGGGGADTGLEGQPALLSRAAAMGGQAPSGAGVGGVGAAGSTTNGGDGQSLLRSGGGGGAIGRMRFHTRAGAIVVAPTGVLSPSLADSTTTTEAPATVE